MVTLMSPISGGMELRTGSSRLSSGRTTAVPMPRRETSPPQLRSASSPSMTGSCKACPTDEGTASTSMRGSCPEMSSSGKACGKSRRLSCMKTEDLFCGSLIQPSDQSQQNDASPASRILRMTRRSHSFRAFSPTNT